MKRLAVASWLLLTLLVSERVTAAVAEPPAGVFNILDYGAKGDGASLDTAAIQKAVDACAAAGGGRVLLPAGRTYVAGAITLRSSVDFHVPRGAVLQGSADWRDFGREGALLFARDAQGLSISGDGVLDGNDRAVWQRLADEEAQGDVNRAGWWPEAFCGDWWPFWKPKPNRGGRPRMVLLLGCSQVRLRDLTLRHAPSWTVHLVGCDDVAVESISVRNRWDVPNNDGLDIDHCRNVRIANCHLEAADDTIALKNTANFANYGACENITVTGCTLASRSAAVKLDEAQAAPGIRDVVIANCVIRRSNRGLCIQSRDVGNIENVLFANLTIETQFQSNKWWGAAEPIHVSHWPRTQDTQLGRVRNLRFSHILCRSENGVYLRGWTNRPIEEVVFDDVRVEVGRNPEAGRGFYDGRPDGLFRGIYVEALAGIRAEHLRGLTLNGTRVAWDESPAGDYGPALVARQVMSLETESFSGSAAHPGAEPDRVIEP